MTSKISKLQRAPETPKSPPGDSRVSTLDSWDAHFQVLDHLGPADNGNDWVVRFCGRSGKLILAQQVRRAELDDDAKSMWWVRLARPYVEQVLAAKRFGGLVEVLVWLWAAVRVRPSGVTEINQRELSRVLGHSGHMTVQRAVASLVDKGLLRKTSDPGLFLLEPGSATSGKLKRRDSNDS